MSIKILSVLLATLMLACSCASITPRNVEDLSDKPELTLGQWQYSVTVRVYVSCDDSQSTGSGVAVGSGKAVTAWHVVDGEGCFGPTTITIKTLDGRETTVFVGKHDEEVDFAVLHTPAGFFEDWATPAPIVPELDDAVCSVGGDWNVYMSRKCGTVIAPQDDFEAYIMTNIWTKRGNSGGPLFRGRQLVGLVVRASMSPDREYLSLSTPATLWAHWVN